jgi:hypothetical protein
MSVVAHATFDARRAGLIVLICAFGLFAGLALGSAHSQEVGSQSQDLFALAI